MDFSERKVSDIMKKIDNPNLYMLDVDTLLDIDKIKEITNMGFSCIPVYKTHRNNIWGIFYMDDIVNLLSEKNKNNNTDWPYIGSIARYTVNVHKIMILESKPLKML